MTKEQLEKLKTALEDWKNTTYEGRFYQIFYKCCDNLYWKGHTNNCLAKECLQIVNDEIDKLETEENIKF